MEQLFRQFFLGHVADCRNRESKRDQPRESGQICGHGRRIRQHLQPWVSSAGSREANLGANLYAIEPAMESQVAAGWSTRGGGGRRKDDGGDHDAANHVHTSVGIR